MMAPVDRETIPTIRPADVVDLAALTALRNFYVANSHATFDERPLTPQDTVAWMAGFAASGPWRLLVAVEGERLLGFCSSQRYRDHPAFAATIETSIYVGSDAGRRGVASRLYDALFRELAGQGLHRAVVGIALPNDASVALHEKLGFTRIGIFDEYARKNGVFISSQWMERRL